MHLAEQSYHVGTFITHSLQTREWVIGDTEKRPQPQTRRPVPEAQLHALVRCKSSPQQLVASRGQADYSLFIM